MNFSKIQTQVELVCLSCLSRAFFTTSAMEGVGSRRLPKDYSSTYGSRNSERMLPLIFSLY